MEFVEPDDGPPFRHPPSLDDRLWRHPSELGGTGASRLVPRRTVWAVAAVAALGASVLTSALVVAVDTLRHDSDDGAVPVRSSQPVSTATEPAVAIAERARPAVVQVHNRRQGSEVDGSAVLFRDDGHLLTNAHVVEGAGSVDVTLANGQQHTGRVVGSDPDTDAAVVKIDGGPFPVVEMGTAADLKVGQMAVAMGSPLALVGGPSVTVGVVSALHRTVRTRTNARLFDMIQTDAPIAPGSSGGALLDANGRLIGITTAVAVTDVGPEGLGFATPIDVARSVADQLIATGRATHAWMGIEGNDLDGATARALSVDGGALVLRVVEGSPAAAAGLADRDVIVRVDGKPVASMGTLVAALRERRPGDVVALDVVRDRNRHTRSVTLAERPANP